MANKAKNILIITGWSFDDALIQTYTLPYVKIIKQNLPEGSELYLYTQQQLSYSKNIRKNEQQKKILSDSGIHIIESKYRRFGIFAILFYFITILKLSIFCFRKNINTIHTWCTPAGSMGYLISILTNKKLVLDSFEPHALPMIEGNTWTKNSLAFKVLFFFEKKQLKRADEVICTVEKMIEHSQTVYGITKKRYFAKPACVDLNLFSDKNIRKQNLLDELKLNNAIICVYAGKFGGLYLEKEVFDFFRIASEYFGERFKVLLLTSHSDEEVENYSAASNLKKEVIVKRFVSHADIPDYIGLADFAICPMKPLPSRRYGTPIKNGEYWALGLPIVITKNISDDSDIIKENKIGSIIEEFTKDAYLISVKEIDQLLKNNTRTELYNKIRPVAEKYRNFSIAATIYKEIYGTK